MDLLFPQIGNVERIPLALSPIRAIQEAVCAKHGITLSDMLGPKRERKYFRARREAMQRARKLTDATYPELGRAFKRDHTTVMSACRVLKKKL